MDKEEELVQELERLHIRQAEIISKLQQKRSNRKSSRQDTNLKPGDKVQLLTKGVLSAKGDLAQIIRISGDTVHLKILKNDHHTHRKIKNVRRAE